MPKLAPATQERFSTIQELSFNKEYSTWTYLAKDSNSYPVIIKVIQATDEQAEQVEREIECLESNKLLISFDYHEISAFRGSAFKKKKLTREYQLVTELIPGQNLQEFITRNTFTPAEWFSLFYHLASALNHFHESGYAHRDIKPDNFIINENGIHTIDFGHSIKIDYANQFYTVGRLSFAAPEVLLANEIGQAVNNQFSDITSLGYSFMYLLDCINISPYLLPVPDFNQKIPERLKEIGFNPNHITALIDIIKRMITESPTERPTLATIANEMARLLENAPSLEWISTKKFQPLEKINSQKTMNSEELTITSMAMTMLCRHGYPITTVPSPDNNHSTWSDQKSSTLFFKPNDSSAPIKPGKELSESSPGPE